MSYTQRPTVPEAEAILGRYYPVLDHGFISLVDYMGSDDAIEQAARVSYGKGTRRTSETRGLIRYLTNHEHVTPSEMVEAKFHCSMPIFVARQWIRHRTASVNEQSSRYSILPCVFYTPTQDVLLPQSEANKQGREGDAMPDAKYREIVAKWEELRQSASDIYDFLLGNDVTRELARLDLPVSIYTQWYWKMDLNNLGRFLSLRCDSHAQWEVRQYAYVLARMTERLCPLAYEAWLDYGFQAVKFSRMEMDAIRVLLAVKDGCLLGSMGWRELANHGLTKREIADMAAKLESAVEPPPPLDDSLFMSAEDLEERQNATTENRARAR